MFDKDLALAVMQKYKEVIPWCCFIPFDLRRDGCPTPGYKPRVPLIDFMDENQQEIYYSKSVDEFIDLRSKGIYQCVGFYTGEKAGITLIDLDSKVAKESLENYVGMPIEEFCGFILDTTKGYHLYFNYTPKLETIYCPRHVIHVTPQYSIDIKNGGYFGLSVGVPGYNDRLYSVHGDLNQLHLKSVPDKLFDYIDYVKNTYMAIDVAHVVGNNEEDIKKFEENMERLKIK